MKMTIRRESLVWMATFVVSGLIVACGQKPSTTSTEQPQEVVPTTQNPSIAPAPSATEASGATLPTPDNTDKSSADSPSTPTSAASVEPLPQSRQPGMNPVMNPVPSSVQANRPPFIESVPSAPMPMPEPMPMPSMPMPVEDFQPESPQSPEVGVMPNELPTSTPAVPPPPQPESSASSPEVDSSESDDPASVSTDVPTDGGF